MGTIDLAVDQLVEEAQLRAESLDPILGVGTAFDARPTIRAAAAVLVADLRSSDQRVASEAARTVMSVLWTAGAMLLAPEDVGAAAWWRTPVGRLCARALAGAVDGSVTAATAAEILGVARGTVAGYVHNGTLQRGAGGYVGLASVLERVGRSAR